LLSLNEDGTALVLRKALPIGEIAEHRMTGHESRVHSPHRGGKARRMHGQEATCFEKE
jgi:hypothetical protein